MAGYIYRRMGQFEKSFEYLNRAISLNPSSSQEWTTAGATLVYLRRNIKAEEYFKTSIDLNPSNPAGYSQLIRNYLITGDVEKARLWFATNPSVADQWMFLLGSLTELLDRNYDEAIRIIESSPNELLVWEDEYTSKSMQLGLIYLMMSKTELATTHFQESRQLLENKLSESPGDSRLHSSLGIIYAGLGMKEEALKAGIKALSIINISVDAVEGFYRELDMARILVMTGKYDEAITKLEFILQKNGKLSIEMLKRDPFWDPLRNIDTFKALIENPRFLVSLDDN